LLFRFYYIKKKKREKSIGKMGINTFKLISGAMERKVEMNAANPYRISGLKKKFFLILKGFFTNRYCRTKEISRMIMSA